MSSPQDRNKQSQAAQPRKSSAVEQVVVTKKTQPPKPVTKEVVAKKAEEVASILVTPVMVDDRPLREFLLAADLHAQQTFLAQVAVCAVKEAQNHAFAPLQDLRKQNAALVEQQQQDQQLLANHQAQHQQLLAEHATLQKQLAQQKASTQQISDQYAALLSKKTEPIKPKPETAPKKKSIKPDQDAVWTDPKTGLMWSRISIGQAWSNGQATGEAKKLSWKAAGEACAAFDLAGFNDWRLPEKTELESLMRLKEQSTPFSSLLSKSYKDILDTVRRQHQTGYATSAGALLTPKENEFGTYWSKTVLPSAEVSIVNFDQSQVLSRGKRSSLYVRAVRKVT